MSDSAKPSERYSLSGSVLLFWNGKTAIESIATSVLRACRYMPSPIAPAASTSRATANANLCCLIPETMYSALDGGVDGAVLDEIGSGLSREPRVEPAAPGAAGV